MARHRDIAASPVRTAAETWDVIRDLIAATLGRSEHIDGELVRRVLDDAAPAGTALVAAGYTGGADITLVAAPLRLTIRTVGGSEAFKAHADENLNPVPGAATAQDWTVYLPRPAGLSALVDDVIGGAEHLSSGPPPQEAQESTNSNSAVIDLRRLDPARRS